MMRNLSRRPPQIWSHLYPQAAPDILDLVSKTLCFSPRERLSACEALEHPALHGLHITGDEPVAETPFRFVTEEIPADIVKEMIDQEVRLLKGQQELEIPVTLTRSQSHDGIFEKHPMMG